MDEKKYKYRFTLFTPCYNSAKFIDRIKFSVENQTFKDYEWIVVNDNSSDNTLELLQDYIKNVNFPVKLINNNKNMMLAVNYNLAFEQAEGEYFVTLDHDDEYSPRYLEIMDELIKQHDSQEVAGIVARCQTQFGRIMPKNEYTAPLMTWFEYGHEKNGRGVGEVPRAFKTDVLKKYMPLDPAEIHNPLLEAMMSFDGYKFITTSEIIRKYYVNEEGLISISHSSNRLTLWNYRRATNEINKYSKHYHMSFKTKMHWWIQYGAASIRYGVNFTEAIANIERWKIPVIICYPLAIIKVLICKIPILSCH
jgi:glycosyltransferase involved in cell wall biosynthesis